MKKIISMGIASAVLALTAVAAYADAAATDPMTILPRSDAPVAGDTFVVDIAAAAEGEATQFNVVWTGLELTNAEYDTTKATWAAPNAKGNNRMIYTADFQPGDIIITLTFTVTAKAGEEVSVSLSEENPKFNLTTPVEQKFVAIEGGDTSDLTPGSDSESGSDSGSESTGDGTTNPPTGIALAIVPAVLAGAGVVVAKKRK